MSVTKEDITLLLRRIDERTPGAMDELMNLVHSDLERMAMSHLRRQFGARIGQITLEPAALVNESFLQLIRQRKGFDNRGQFFAIATKVMLRVLMDYRRSKATAKRAGDRGGSPSPVTIAISDPHADGRGQSSELVEIEALVEAMRLLEDIDPRRAEIVKMRIIWSMTVPEIATALEISPSSVDRDWRWAKCWLADQLGLIED